MTPGSPRDPVTDAQLRGKWLDCCAEVGPRSRQGEEAALFREGMRLDEDGHAGMWLGHIAAMVEVANV